MRAIQLLSVCFILLFANSCKNDIDINAPWKETPVVYAFIDPNTNIQYFRIQKTYQNATDLSTSEGAQIADSLYFDTLVVKVIDGNFTYTFNKTQSVPKDDGFFASGAHFLYACPNFTGMVNRDYTLKIYSPKTGNTYTSTTRCVGPSAITAVRLRFDGNNVNAGSTITTSVSAGSSITDQILRMVYLEYPAGGTGGDTLNADYVLNSEQEPYNTGTGNFRIKTPNFLNGIKAVIPDKPGVERKVIRIDFVNVGGAKELADLIELSKPSISIVQKKVDYTNITNGLGIFSSRSYKLTTNIESFESQWTIQKSLLVDALNATDYSGIVAKNLHFVQ